MSDHLPMPVIDDGDSDPVTRWREPDSALTPAGLAIASVLEQVIYSYAQAVDSQDPAAVANLFTEDGKFSLYYVNQLVPRRGRDNVGAPAERGPPPPHRDGTPPFWSPTGRAPSATPTGGAAGGGCVAVGRQAIANYVRGSGLAKGYQFPVLLESRTVLLNNRVQLNKSDPKVATSHSYYQNDKQIFVSYRLLPKVGWKISQLDLVFNTENPTLPCQN
jgi:hypothetical protein